MVAVSTTRRVLEAVARVLPVNGDDVVTRVDVRDGWGGAVHVRVHSRLARAEAGSLGPELRAAMAAAVPGRHTVEIVWASSG